MAPGIVLLIFAVLGLLVAVPLVLRCIRLPKWMSSTKVACGGCGYPYSGQAVCSECGQKIASVGVVTPYLALKLRGGVVTGALALLFLFGVAFFFMGMSATVFTQQFVRDSGQYMLKPTILSPGDSVRSDPGPLYILELTIRHDKRGIRTQRNTVTAVLAPKAQWEAAERAIPANQPSAGFAKAVVERPGGATVVYDARDHEIARAAAFDRAMAQRLYREAGLDRADAPNPFIEVGIDSLVDIVNAEVTTLGIGAGSLAKSRDALMTMGKLGSQGGGTRTSRGLPPVWGVSGDTILLTAMGIIWNAVYVWTFLWMMRRRTRLMGV